MNLSSCSVCGRQIVVHQTTMDDGGNITHSGNEWTQLPDICNECLKKTEEALTEIQKERGYGQ